MHVDKAFGNHLFVNKEISKKFQSKIKGKFPHEIYGEWLEIALMM